MKRETHFIVWADKSITVMWREKRADGTLSDYTETHTYTGEEAKELSEQFAKVVRG